MDFVTPTTIACSGATTFTTSSMCRPDQREDFKLIWLGERPKKTSWVPAIPQEKARYRQLQRFRSVAATPVPEPNNRRIPITGQLFPVTEMTTTKKKCGTRIIFLSLSTTPTFTINYLKLRAPPLRRQHLADATSSSFPVNETFMTKEKCGELAPESLRLIVRSMCRLDQRGRL